MADIQIFNSPQFGEIRTAGTSEQPLFCLADLCHAIGIKDVSKCASRLDEDVRQTHPLLTKGGTQQATFVTEAGMYDVIIRSDSDKAKPFRKWITSEVLPSIRKTGGYSVKTEVNIPTIGLKDQLTWVKETKKLLSLDNHSTLGMLQKIAGPLGLPLPEFVDEEAAFPISELFKKKRILNKKGKYMSGIEGNKRLLEAGLVEQVSRYSRSKGKDVLQWVITKKGEKYGKMHQHKDASFPSPEWFLKKADELMSLLGLSTMEELPYAN